MMALLGENKYINMNQYYFLFLLLFLLTVMIRCSSGKCSVNGNWMLYNTSRQKCCRLPGIASGWQILDIGVEEDPKDYHCCNGRAFKNSDYHCCDGLILKMTNKTTNKQCCGKVLFDSQEQFCCNEKLHERFIVDVTKKERDCCSDAKTIYTIGEQRCTKTEVLPFDNKRCGDKLYDITAESCCNDVVSDRHSEINPDNACCGNKSYSMLDGNCCHDEETGRNYVIGEAFECCGSGKILKAKQFCCNGIGYNRSSDLQCCGDVGVFNKNHQKCCKSGRHYALAAMSGAKDHGKCCGHDAKLQAYDDREDKCCGEQLINKSLECLDCDGKFMPNGHLCCRARPTDSGGVIVKKNKTSDNVCCYNEAANNFTTINTQLKEYCQVCSLVGYERRWMAMCGSTVINKLTHSCCIGIPVLKLKGTEPGECCKNKLYNPNTQECCYGEIIDSREWQCCKIPKQKRKRSEKCEKFEMCGDRAIDPRTRMCCDENDHAKSDRYGNNYTCCGSDSIRTTNYNAQCCAGERIDPDTQKCCGGKPMSKDENCNLKREPQGRVHGVSNRRFSGNDDDCKRSFPPHDVSDACSGHSYDMKMEWCLKGKIVPLKDITPGSCSSTSTWKDILKTLVQPQPPKEYIWVIMTTSSPLEVLRTSSGGKVLYRQARIVNDLTREKTRRSQLGKRLNLLIPLHGQDRCSDVLEDKYRRFILVTSQEPWRGMLMFERNDLLLKYEGRFVKRMEEVLYARRKTRKRLE